MTATLPQPITEDRTEETEFHEVVFYGSSDDLIEVEGNLPGCDEYNGELVVFEVAGVHVKVEYMPNGCWGITVWQVDEDVPVKAANMGLSVPPRRSWSDEVLAGKAPVPAPGYSMRLQMDVPSDSRVVKIEKSDAAFG